jgi:UDP-3-O-[3-hydroxymyristoyl] glucosamine N-acyltransferase
VGMAGSAKFGKYCLVAGQVGVNDHGIIGDYSQVGGQAGILRELPPKSVVTGTPARPFKEQRKKEAYISKLGKLFKKVKDLESEIETLKRKGH